MYTARGNFALLGGLHLALIASVSSLAVAGAARADDSGRSFNIPTQAAALGIREFAREADVQVLVSSQDLQGKQTNALQGRLPVQVALNQLLSGTGIRVVSNNGSALVLAAGQSAVEKAPSDGVSQQNNPHELETITVTARKQVETLEDVPVAVSAISKMELQNNLVRDLSQIGELAPQVMIAHGASGTGAVLTIRGISSDSTDSGLDQSVLVSMDGVSLSRGRVASLGQFDMQQVEILEGPQALFFGKNSPAGVISIASVDPTDKFEGYVKAGYEFEAEEKYFEAAMSGPITDTLKARLAFKGDWINGWISNIAPAEANPFAPNAPLPGAIGQSSSPKGNDINGRLTVMWDPADDFSAKLKLTMGRSKLNSNAAYGETYCADSTGVPEILGVPEPHADCAANEVKAENNLPALFAVNYPYGNGGVPYEHDAYGLLALTLNKKFDTASLTSTTGYYDQQHRAGNPGAEDEFATIWDVESERYRMVNEELRLNTDFSGPINFMLGAYFEHSDRYWFNAPDILNTFNPELGNYTTTETTTTTYADSYSTFGQLRWKIVPNLELAGGARFTRDIKTSALENIANNLSSPLGATLYPQGEVINVRYAKNNVSPEATLTWKPEQSQTLYAAYKTGYKAGGISSAGLLDATATPSSLVLGPENVKGFEVGYKADLLANTLRLDLTAYRYNYNGLQVTARDSTLFSFIILNAAKARTSGVEGSFTWLATDKLSFNGNIGYNHARFLQFPNAPCYAGQTADQGCVGSVQNLAGQPLNRAPDVTFKLGADYRADIVQGWITDLSVSAAYSSSYQTGTDYAPAEMQSAFWLLGAAIHVSPESGKYQLALIGRNLTNTYYKVISFPQALGNPGQFDGYFNQPRSVALELSYNF